MGDSSGTAMADHQQRRLLSVPSRIVGVARRVVEGMGDLIAAGLEFDRLRVADDGWIEVDLEALLDHFDRRGGNIDPHDRHRLRCAARGDVQIVATGRQRRSERVKWREQRAQGIPSEEPHPVKPILGVDRNNAAVEDEAVPPHGKAPLWYAELRIHEVERLRTAVVVAEQVPPARAVGDEVQDPRRRPLRLEDRIIRATGDQFRL